MCNTYRILTVTIIIFIIKYSLLALKIEHSIYRSTPALAMLIRRCSFLLTLMLNILSCNTQGKATIYYDQLAIYTLAIVSLEQTSPSYSPVCPGDNVVFTCNVTGNILIWDYYGQARAYLDGSSSETVLLGGFNISLISIMNGVIRSEARLQHVTSNDNGRNINCTDTSAVRHQATVIVAGKLACHN